jgi:hypothetical protein
MGRQLVPVAKASTVQAKGLERVEDGSYQQGVFLIQPQRCSQFLFLIRVRQIEQAERGWILASVLDAFGKGYLVGREESFEAPG